MPIEKEYPAHPDLTGGGEIDLHSHVGAGAPIASGSYTATDVNGRQITVGFKCSLVIVSFISHPYGSGILFGYSGDSYALLEIREGAYPDAHPPNDMYAYLHSTDGFVVGKGGAAPFNAGAYTFRYTAIGE